MNQKDIVFLKKIIERTSFAIFLFCLIGFIYVIGNLWIHPHTMTMPLTHWTLFIQEDEFGILCFIISFLNFLIWNNIRD